MLFYRRMADVAVNPRPPIKYLLSTTVLSLLVLKYLL
jgi:hypothetical protein